MKISSFAPQQQGPAPSEQWAKRLLGVCAVGCVVAVLAACGSSSPSSPSTSSNSPLSSSSSATSASAVTPASLSQLKKIALQPADLPSGWKGTPYQGGPDDSAVNADLYKCIGARDTDSDKVAEAHSRDFTLGNADISSSAVSYRSQSDLNTDIAMLHSPKISPCLEQMMKNQVATSLPAGGTIASVSVKVTPGSAGLANVVATGTGTITISVNGQQVSVYLTTAFITGPLIEAEIDTSNVGTPVPASVVNSLVATVATRAAKG